MPRFRVRVDIQILRERYRAFLSIGFEAEHQSTLSRGAQSNHF